MALGITDRLVLSFAAVAVLAAAANLIAEDGVEVIRTHHLDLGLTSATPTIDDRRAALRIAINVSPRQLMDRRFADLVLELLGEYRLPARCIELELTESVLQTGPATIESLRHLRSHDIAIALDDFGTGYSSLASLENLPLSRIKLDRSLIAGIDRNPRSAAIAASLIGLCKGLGLEVTAEGVERPEQFAALAHHRSIHLQGYLISKPVAADAVLSVKRLIPRIMQDLLLGLPGTGSGIRRMDFESSSYLASESGKG